MADIEELKDLVAQQVREGANSRKMVDDLIAQMAWAAVVAPLAEGEVLVHHVPVMDDAARAQAIVSVRAEKISKITINLRKSNKVKEFKDSLEVNVKEWLI